MFPYFFSALELSSSIGIISTAIAVGVAIAVIAFNVVAGVLKSIILRALFGAPKPSSASFGFTGPAQGSPRYGTFGPLTNTISNEVAVPVTYGTIQMAGNSIWQGDPGKEIDRIVAITEGEIEAIYDVRANDNPYSELDDSNFTVYLGTATQKADSRLPGKLRADMELHNLAYIATHLKSGKHLNGGDPVITSIVKGLKVEVWRGGAWTTTKEFSRNPAACVRDLFINERYGLGIPKANLDEDSFGETYDYCEELVALPANSGFEGFKSATVVFLRMDGANNSTTFIDSGLADHPITVFGDAKIDTSQFRFGGASGRFDGVGDYLKVEKPTKEKDQDEVPFPFLDFNFKLDDFEVSFWVRFSSVAASHGFFSIGGSAVKMSWDQATSNLTAVIGKTTYTRSWSPVINIWYYLTLNRQGKDVKIFIDGVKQGATGSNSESLKGGENAEVGRSDSSVYLNGWMDDFKVVKGAVVNTVDFTPPGDKESRYRLDYTIDSLKPAQDVLKDMLSSFLGFLVYSGSKIKLRLEKAENVTQYFGDGSTTKQNATFDPNNIVKDSFNWSMSGLDERPNRIRIQWVDPDQNYVKVYSQVDDRTDQETRRGIVPKDIALLAITRQSQVSRIARLHMAVAKFVSMNVSFTTRLESIHCEVGDVIAVTHQASKFVRRLFRITEMQEAEDEHIRITAEEYNASIYDDHPATQLVTFQGPAGPNLFAPLSDVTNLAVREDNFVNKDGVFVTNLLLSWTAISGDQLLRLVNYFVEISEDGGATYRPVSYVDKDATGYRIDLGQVPTGRTYTVRVTTISDKGSQSSGETVQITTAGKQTGPETVEDFDVEFTEDHLTFTWSAVDDADLFAYELRVGDSLSTWETAGIVATEILGTQFYSWDVRRGTWRYFIKAIDNSANYSEEAAQDTITITDLPRRNVVMSLDLFSRITSQGNPPLFGETSQPDSLIVNDVLANSPCLQFDGVHTFIEIPDSADWQLGGGAGDFTIECWVYFHSVASNKNFITQFQDGNNSWSFYYSQTLGGLRFEIIKNGATHFGATNTWTPVANTWYHLVIERYGDLGTFYFDGVKNFQPTFAGVTTADLNGPLHIGMFNTTTSPMHGKIDEVRISNIARYKGQSFNTGKFTRGNDVSAVPLEADSNTHLLLHLDETSGPLAKDSSGRLDSTSRHHHGMVNTDPNWQTGIVGRPVPFIVPYPAADLDPKYNRITLGPITSYSIDGLENLGVTFQQFQDNYGFVWGVANDRPWEKESRYTTEAIRIVAGSAVTATYQLDFQTRSTDNLGFFVAYIATSTDGGLTFSSFTPFVNGQYTANAVKLQFRMQSLSSGSIVRLVSAKLLVDAPDRRLRLSNQSVSAGGRTFYLTGFAGVTSIVLTIVGTSQYVARVDSQTGLPNSFDVKVNDIDGVPVAGSVNLQIEGY